MSKWQEATISSSPTWDREEPIEGEYIEFKQNVGPNESFLYMIETKDGKVGVWGSTTLDTKFTDISLHSKVRIEPLGPVKSEKTGRTYLDFKVLYKEPEYKEAAVEVGSKEPSGYDKAKKIRSELGDEMPEDFLI